MRGLRQLQPSLSSVLAALAALFVGAAGIAFWQWRVIAPVHAPAPITAWNADLYRAYVPVFQYAYRSAELLPTWNPHQLAGTPFWGNANGIFYLPNLVARVVNLPISFGLLCALHLALAGCGAFLAARELSLSVAAATIAGVLFMLSGPCTQAFIHPSHLFGYAWVPWVFVAGARLVAVPRPGRAAALGAAVAMQLLTGSSQIVCYSAYGLAVAGLAYLAAADRWNRPDVVRLLANLALAATLAFLLSAIQVVPTVEVLTHATRGRLAVEATLPNLPSLRFTHAFLVESGPAALLAAAAVLDRERRAVAISAIALLLFAALFALGTPFYRDFFYYLPGIDRFRVPNRMLVVGSFAVATLSALGLDVLRRQPAGGARAGLLLLLLLSAALVDGLGVSAGKHPLLRPEPTAALVLVALAFVALCGSGRLGGAAATALIALTLVERFAQPANAFMMPQHNPEEFFAAPPFVEFLKQRTATDRVLMMGARPFPIMPKAGTLFGIDVVQDYEPLAPHEYQQFLATLEPFNMDSPLFWGRFHPPPIDDAWRPLDMMATRYAVVEAGVPWLNEPNPRFRQVYDDASVTIYENLRALPRAYLVERASVIADREAALERVHDPTFDPRDEVVLDRPPVWSSSDRQPELAQKAEIADVLADQVVLRVTTARPAVLVLSDLDWPGWQASVDGTPTPIYRANFLFRGVAIDAGVHEVRFRYRPWTLPLGMAVSIATAGTLLTAAAWTARRRAAARQARFDPLSAPG